MKMKRMKTWLQHSEKGQSLVEFTASVIVLMIIVGGVLDIGRAYMTYVALENGVGEGAVFASYHPTWVTETQAAAGGSSYPATENITYRTTHESPSGIVDWSKTTVSVEFPPGYPPVLQAGTHITVSATYSYTVITPFMFILLPDGQMPLTAEAQQMIVHVD